MSVARSRPRSRAKFVLAALAVVAFGILSSVADAANARYASPDVLASGPASDHGQTTAAAEVLPQGGTDGGGAQTQVATISPTLSQYASSVIDFSSQYSGGGWSAAQALGPPNTFGYGDISTSWTSASANQGMEYLTLGFDTPVFATGVTVRETYNNGFVTQVDIVDLGDALHTFWTGVDPSAPGAPVDFLVTASTTGFLVKGVKVYVDTEHTSSWEEIDSVELHGLLAANIQPVSYDMQNGESGTYPLRDDAYDGTGSVTTDGSALSGGRGQLTDGVVGVDDWALDIGNGRAQEWVGWNSIQPTVTFDFGQTVQLGQASIHVNNFGTEGVNLFATTTFEFSTDDVSFGDPITYTTSPQQRADTTARYIYIGISREARYVRVSFADGDGPWILISEIAFVGLLPPPPRAATINAPAEVLAGSLFAATVDLAHVSSLQSADYVVTFDPNTLDLIAVSGGAIGNTAVPVDDWNVLLPGKVNILQSLPTSTPSSGSGVLAQLFFNATTTVGATSTVQFVPAESSLTDSDGAEITTQRTGADVTVVAGLGGVAHVALNAPCRRSGR